MGLFAFAGGFGRGHFGQGQGEALFELVEAADGLAVGVGRLAVGDVGGDH